MVDPTHGLFRLPSKEERRIARNGAPLNPFKLAMMLTPLQGAMFFSGWFAWTIDAWDFFAVSLSVTNLANTFHKQPSDITTAITLTLLFRSVGAIFFGYVHVPSLVFCLPRAQEDCFTDMTTRDCCYLLPPFPVSSLIDMAASTPW